MTEKEEKIIQTAVWGYRQFARSIANEDVAVGRYSETEARVWVNSMVKDFEKLLKEITS